MLSKVDKLGHSLTLFRKSMVSITIYHEGLRVVPYSIRTQNGGSQGYILSQVFISFVNIFTSQ